MKKIVFWSLLIVGSLYGANCQEEVNDLLEKVSFAKQFGGTAQHYVAYKQAEDTMRACRYRISDNDMMNLITIKNQQKELAGK